MVRGIYYYLPPTIIHEQTPPQGYLEGCGSGSRGGELIPINEARKIILKENYDRGESSRESKDKN